MALHDWRTPQNNASNEWITCGTAHAARPRTERRDPSSVRKCWPRIWSSTFTNEACTHSQICRLSAFGFLPLRTGLAPSDSSPSPSQSVRFPPSVAVGQRSLRSPESSAERSF
ncbi:hypothetical protein MPTK1_5g02310 [Marchantia polymorpha subsp. ruderalis]|uniref:Uncharacterized protein n=2 Tax=Marchantia polymorpha TaxID=3197 RepID=A0AAF6BE50_MARPO|nr:hypothetical protein MARPO_0147s0024 [Marchantia polymorpha]BBN10284.1 hypothetical protein Mp_5g02310 [Marchantia polymorpha subsp. ruderalis]|eukprot:PTQ29145.1 hypothetical protein MARPO_0147s0024 [Marchantia polymorpha]